jgi:uncharacterized protein
MASGLIALFDDVAAIAKLAAASLDDVAAAAGKAGAKAAGVVIDDTAVTPAYVTGFTPDRELPIIAKIARGSIINKLLIILPAALLLNAFAPFLLTPLLMLGGTYLCYEAAEKVMEGLGLIKHDDAVADAIETLNTPQMETEKVKGAIRTDFILSSEIMVIALSEVANRSISEQALILALVAIGITLAVYGVVALIVKMDDIGLHLAKGRRAGPQALGRALVAAMPKLLAGLGSVGTAAMAWVGGGIIIHGLEHFQLKALPNLMHGAGHRLAGLAPALSDLLNWLGEAMVSAIVGLLLGSAFAVLLMLLARLHGKAAHTDSD